MPNPKESPRRTDGRRGARHAAGWRRNRGERLAADRDSVRAAACGRVDMAQRRCPSRSGRRVAGHSVAVLLKVYAKCIAGQEEDAKRRIAEAAKPRSIGDAPAETSARIRHGHPQSPDDHRTQSDGTRTAPVQVLPGQGPFGCWWRVQDLNLGRLSRRIYSAPWILRFLPRRPARNPELPPRRRERIPRIFRIMEPAPSARRQPSRMLLAPECSFARTARRCDRQKRADEYSGSPGVWGTAESPRNALAQPGDKASAGGLP